ncbi:Translin-1 [Blastocladiella emersonii ATCC 22665]|nr:Translin-1 [Blastocladiella emersonii ATCC 22665]
MTTTNEDSTVALAMFGDLQSIMDAEADRKDLIRTAVRELEREIRGLTTELSRVHMDVSQASTIATASLDRVAAIRGKLAAVAAQVPASQFFRYYQGFSNSLSSACGAVVLREYLATGQLASTALVSEALGVPVEVTAVAGDAFHVPLDDYLLAVAGLPSDLSRLAVNAAAQRDFARPASILAFVMRVQGGFQLLNLKNDGLRRKYDSIKYDVKKIEEVVYDIKMRGLDAAGN